MATGESSQMGKASPLTGLWPEPCVPGLLTMLYIGMLTDMTDTVELLVQLVKQGSSRTQCLSLFPEALLESVGVLKLVGGWDKYEGTCGGQLCPHSLAS